jgi:hypothetical protein
MFDFEKFLKDLIIKNRRVIIPELGAFLLTDASNSKSVIFSAFLRYNDGFLESSLQQNGITEQDSVNMIKNFVSNVNDSLDAGENFHISDLGYFTKDGKGIQFVFEIETDVVQPLPPPVTPPVPANNWKNINPNSNKDRKPWIIAGIACTFVIIVLGAYFLFSGDGGNNNIVKAPIPEATPVTPPEPKDDDKSANIQQPVVQPADLRYHVIAGCFAEKINAERFLQTCKELKFVSAEILPQIGELYPVSIEKFATLNEANRKRDAYNEEYDSEAWVYKTY